MIPAAIVFLLFFAILAFAWFYLQRAKLRDANKVETVEESSVAPRTVSDTTPDPATPPTDPAP